MLPALELSQTGEEPLTPPTPPPRAAKATVALTCVIEDQGDSWFWLLRWNFPFSLSNQVGWNKMSFQFQSVFSSHLPSWLRENFPVPFPTPIRNPSPLLMPSSPFSLVEQREKLLVRVHGRKGNKTCPRLPLPPNLIHSPSLFKLDVAPSTDFWCPHLAKWSWT